MREMFQRNAILIYFVDVGDWCKLCVGVCIGKPYCPYLNGAHFSLATPSPDSILHPFHKGLQGGRQLCSFTWLFIIPSDEWTSCDWERKDGVVFSMLLCYVDWYFCCCLFVFWAIVLVCNPSLQQTHSPPNSTSCLCLWNGEITSRYQHWSWFYLLWM
jgi:hypothetical protein